MNEIEQIIAIAKACGWEIQMTGFKVWQHWHVKHPDKCPSWRSAGPYLPDYLNDLNAMHEAEMILYKNSKLPKKYTQQLKFAICREAGCKKAHMDFDMCITATAKQRAEAFLRTLKLWEK